MSTTVPFATEIDQQDIDEARAFNIKLEALIASSPSVHTLPAGATRQVRRVGKGIFPAPVFIDEARDIEVAGPAGPIKVRVIRPDQIPTGIYLQDRTAAANLVFGAYVLSRPIVKWFSDNFLPDRSFEQRRDPDISPLYADLSGMPRALFSVGTMDCLLDDSLFMAERWRLAGNDAEVAIYPEGVHGFNAYPTGLARKANARQFEFLRQALA